LHATEGAQTLCGPSLRAAGPAWPQDVSARDATSSTPCALPLRPARPASLRSSSSARPSTGPTAAAGRSAMPASKKGRRASPSSSWTRARIQISPTTPPGPRSVSLAAAAARRSRGSPPRPGCRPPEPCPFRRRRVRHPPRGGRGRRSATWASSSASCSRGVGRPKLRLCQVHGAAFVLPQRQRRPCPPPPRQRGPGRGRVDRNAAGPAAGGGAQPHLHRAASPRLWRRRERLTPRGGQGSRCCRRRGPRGGC
jgi:hypothetical protein